MSIRTLGLSVYVVFAIAAHYAPPAIAACAIDSTTADISVEASRPAPNDLIRATVTAEDSGPSQAAVSARINGVIADALKIAKSYPTVQTQSGGTNTFPIYSKAGKIEAWRMRSELRLESVDAAGITAMLGQLQSTVGVSNLVLLPAPATRAKAADQAILDALVAFNARARLVADALQRPYRIKSINVSVNGHYPQPMFRRAGTAMMAEGAPMPVEAGESQVTAIISGQIELP